MRGATTIGAKFVAGALAAGALVVVAFAVGRATAHTTGARDSGYRQGRSAGYDEGLRVGEQQGVREGRALQETRTLPPSAAGAARLAFDDGYAAGANDAFGGYDGGWAPATPYVVTLEPGTRGVTYRIASRVTLEPGVRYELCAGGHRLCPLH